MRDDTTQKEQQGMAVNTNTARARFVADGMATLTGPRLLVALYERLVRDLDDATDAVRRAAPADAHERLTHAQDIVHELVLALDGNSWDAAGHLADVYGWLYRQLVTANVDKDLAVIESCRSLVAPLRDAWIVAADDLTARAAS
jgi:flagellar protein FliS